VQRCDSEIIVGRAALAGDLDLISLQYQRYGSDDA